MGRLELSKIVEILDATVISDTGGLDIDIQRACSTDLISNVLLYFATHSILVTGLIHSQVVRAAEIAGIKSIVFVQNKKPAEDTIKLANQKKIPLLTTPFCMFTASGKLFQAGLRGCQKR